MANGLKGWEQSEFHGFFEGKFQIIRFENSNFPDAYIIQAFDNSETATETHCNFSVYKGGKLYDIVDTLKEAIEKAEY